MSFFTLPVCVDLLSTPDGEPLLVGETDLPAPVAAVLFDHETREVGFEFAGGVGYVPCNIPVDDDHLSLIRAQGCAFVATLDAKNKLSTISVVQLYHQSIREDEIYIPPFYGTMAPIEETRAVLGHIKRGQPLNRPNLVEGGNLRGVLFSHGVESPKSLELSVRLQHELNTELAARRQMAPNLSPRMAPPSLGPRGGGTPAATLNLQNFSPSPPNFPEGEG